MDRLKIKNNAVSRLSGNLSATDTSISLLPGDGAKFPVLAAGEWFPATLVKVDGTLEIIRVTARATDVLTAVRGQEATAAITFSAGDRVEHRFTAAAFGEENARIEAIAQNAFDNAGAAVAELTDGLAGASGAEMVFDGEESISSILKNSIIKVVTSVAALRAVDKSRCTHVITTGYWASGDGGRNKYWRDLSDVTSADDGGSVIVAADGARWKPLDIRSMSVLQWGCRWNGTSDDTPRAQAAIDYFITKGGMLRFPASGTGWITSLTVRRSLYTLTLHNDGSYMEAISTDPQLAILNIVGCVNVLMTGAWRFNGANKNNYGAALAIRVDPDTNQSTTRIKIYNITVRNSPIGIRNGEYNNDLQCSEIGIFGAEFFQCPQPIYNGGSNSGMQLIGCDITSEANGAFAGVVETSILQEGGFLKVTGGSIVCNPTASYCITQAPCQSLLYSGNLYGTLDVVGAHVETNAPLINVQNPRSFSTTDSGYASFKFVGNTGFAGGDTWRDFGYISDSTFAGLVQIKACNWYAAAPRTGYNMSGVSPLARFDIDKTSLGKNFLNWLGGIGFGCAIHDMAPVTSVSGLGVTYFASTTNVLKFQNKIVANELGRYGNQYNPATGTFEVPPGGFAMLQITCCIASSTAVTSGDFYLRRGGSVVAFGVLSGKFGTLTHTLHDLSAGEILDLVILPVGGNFTTDNGLYNSLQIIASTR